MSIRKSRARLLQAVEAQTIVRVERKPKHAGRLVGVMLRVGTKWALMAQTADGGHLDGFVVFRVKDVMRITDDESVAAVFAKTLPGWPPSFAAPLALDSTAGVLDGFGQNGRLVGIQKEKERNGLWVGKLDAIIGRFVYLHEVRFDGTWHPEPLGYRARAITSVEIGTRYFAALTAVAGEGPESRED